MEGSDLTGTYSDPLYGTVRIESTPDGLVLDQGPGLRGPMEHWHYDTWMVRWGAGWRGTATVTFELGADGEVGALRMGNRRWAREGGEG